MGGEYPRPYRGVLLNPQNIPVPSRAITVISFKFFFKKPLTKLTLFGLIMGSIMQA
jgi:hypothetical protein